MNFEWDENKSDVCFDQRGFDFAYVVRAFIDPDRLIKKDTRWDYGEERYQLLGSIAQRVFFVLSTRYAAQPFELFQHARLINAR